jgi:predicted dehydrogenase
MTDRSLVLLGAAHVHLDDHLRVLRDEGWQVNHVHDRDTARRDAFCGRLGAAPLDDLGALADTQALGAIVCSETAFHEADIAAALRAGLPVFTEKPLAGSAAAARRCAELAEDRGLLLQTGYFMRTNPGFATIRGWIVDGAIGSAHEARMRFSHDGGFADWLDLDAWMTEPARACYGGFADEAVHAIDMLQWLLGPAVEGAARTGNALGWPLDDHGAAVLYFTDGATGVVEAGWTDTSMRLELDLTGSEGAIRLSDGRAHLIRRGEDGVAKTVDLAPLDAGEGIRPFLHALDGGESTGLVPPRDAAYVNALLDGMDLRLINEEDAEAAE